jgi:hypothetical protein
MQKRWILSRVFRARGNNFLTPHCAAFGGDWRCPIHPADEANGWALVEIYTDTHRIKGMKKNPKMIVLPLLFDPRPLPQEAIDAYASKGAVPGMSMGALLAMLAEDEPLYGFQL